MQVFTELFRSNFPPLIRANTVPYNYILSRGGGEWNSLSLSLSPPLNPLVCKRILSFLWVYSICCLVIHGVCVYSLTIYNFTKINLEICTVTTLTWTYSRTIAFNKLTEARGTEVRCLLQIHGLMEMNKTQAKVQAEEKCITRKVIYPGYLSSDDHSSVPIASKKYFESSRSVFYNLWFDLGQKYRTPQVRPDRGSNSCPPDHDSTFHVTETPALTTWPSVT